jgi:hypothetical protein
MDELLVYLVAAEKSLGDAHKLGAKYVQLSHDAIG